jgi:hypothetical protein
VINALTLFNDEDCNSYVTGTDTEVVATKPNTILDEIRNLMDIAHSAFEVEPRTALGIQFAQPRPACVSTAGCGLRRSKSRYRYLAFVPWEYTAVLQEGNFPP